MHVHDRPLTWDDLVKLWLPEDGLRYEIICGELVTSPTPWLAHQATVREVMMALYEAAHEQPGSTFLTYVAVKLSPYNIVVPDIVYVAPDRPDVGGEEAIEGVPDLIGEIVNRYTWRMDTITKAALYATLGVREYWLLDPEAKTLVINVLENGQYRQIEAKGKGTPSRIFPELVIDTPSLFPDR
jgi:Uma2 family endonuclease